MVRAGGGHVSGYAAQDWALCLLFAAQPTDRALAGWIAPTNGAAQMLRLMADDSAPKEA